jgi:superoxide dismutase
MNSVKRHKQYVDDLTDLTKASKERNERIIFAHMDKLWKKARGNPDAFKKLIELSEKQVTAKLMKGTLAARSQATEIGKKFAEDRKSDQEPV